MHVLRRSRVFLAAISSLLVASIVFLAVQPSAGQRVDSDEQFRATLTDFYAEFDDAYAPFARIGPSGMKDVLLRARERVPSMTSRELAWMREAYPASFWRDWRTTILPALRKAKVLAPSLQGPILSSTDPLAPSASVMSHTCPQLTHDGSPLSVLAFTVALYYAKSVELVAQIAHNGAGADPTGVATGVAAVPLGLAMTARFILEEIEAKVEACEGEERARILHDVLRPNVDEKVSSRASQTSVDDLKKMIAGMLDDLKRHIDLRSSELTKVVNDRANEIVAIITRRADEIVALVNRRADAIEALVKKRADHIDAYQESVVAHQQLDLQVVEVERGRLILMSGEAGTPFDVLLTSVQVAEAKPNVALAFREIRPTTQAKAIAPGVMEITLDMRGPAKDATVYLITVAHAHTTQLLGTVTHAGTTIVRRNGP